MRLVIGLLLTLTLFGCSQLNLERPSDSFGDFLWATSQSMVRT